MPTALSAEHFAELDRHFAALIERLASADSPGLALAAALVSRQRREGHLCLHLPAVAAKPVGQASSLTPVGKASSQSSVGQASSLPIPAPPHCPPLEDWLTALQAAPNLVGPPGAFAPLILDSAHRLYLQRYWDYEDRLARNLRARAVIVDACDEARLRSALDTLFSPTATPGPDNRQSAIGNPQSANPGPDDQRQAAETAARRRLCVITGGPGTGKTHTLARLLVLLQRLHDPTAPALRFALAAPTGKAAARIQEEIRRAAESLPDPALASPLRQLEARTLHRLLGARPDAATFRHHADNPIAADVVVVDEASMVDLALMAKLLEATPPTARLILLGDPDQLASVEAGAVLADICCGLATVKRPSPSGPIVPLRRNYRFAATSAIHRLSLAINAGDADAALAALRPGGEVAHRPLPARDEIPAALTPLLLEAWPRTLPTDPAEMLACLSRFRVLCAVREGGHGVHRFNQLAEEILARAGRLAPVGQHYAGRPILITRNDHSLRLYNGDVGVLLRDRDGGLRACFASPEGGVRGLAPARLPPHDTVFAMTVHKSQGSEFASILLVLPERDSPVLTRELLYTGLTRARERAELWFTEPVFRAAITRRVERHSGLRDALASAAPA